MQSKMNWVFVSLFIFPLTAYSQVSLRTLSPKKTAFGISVNWYEYLTSVSGSLQYGLKEDREVMIGFSFGFIDKDEFFVGDRGPSELKMPSSAEVGFGILNFESVGQSRFRLFSLINFSTGVISILTEFSQEHARNIVVAASVGITPNPETQSELMIRPFFGLTYGINYVFLTGNRHNRNDFSLGQCGLEIDISPKVSALGTFALPFNNSGIIVGIGLNFH